MCAVRNDDDDVDIDVDVDVGGGPGRPAPENRTEAPGRPEAQNHCFYNNPFIGREHPSAMPSHILQSQSHTSHIPVTNSVTNPVTNLKIHLFLYISVHVHVCERF